MADIIPRQHNISSVDHVIARHLVDVQRYLNLYKPLMLSLPINNDFRSLLTSLSTPLTNRYLVTRVIQCSDGDPDPSAMKYLYDVAKPFVWQR